MKMRKFIALLIFIIVSLSAVVPVYAATKTTEVADCHTKEFREMYARMKENESWETLNPEVKKQIWNYAVSENRAAIENLLCLRAIDLEVYLQEKGKKEEDNIISRFIDILSSKEFQSYIILKELAAYDGYEVRKDERGYRLYTREIPSLPPLSEE